MARFEALKTSNALRLAACVLLAGLALCLTTKPAAAEPAAPSTDVIGGTIVTSDTAYPYLVGLLRNTNPLTQYCGGSLIMAQWVLTAAHCYSPSESVVPTHIVIGRADLTNSAAGEVIPVAGIIQHELWNDVSITNDIMLLRLAYPPATSASAIQRATPAQDPPSGATVHVAGWGNISTEEDDYPIDMYEAPLDVIDQSVCTDIWDPTPVLSSMICAAHLDDVAPRSACNGDSGGPLVYDVPAVGRRLVGIVSFGPEGCFTDFAPGVYTRVSSFDTWITSHTSKWLAPNGNQVDFGSANVDGGTTERTVVFKSVGDQAVSVNSIAASGDYSVTSNTCSGPILSQSSCTAVVTFDPSAGGFRSGALTLNTDSPDAPVTTVQLNGTGIAPINTAIALKLASPKRAKLKRGKLTATFDLYFMPPAGLALTKACAGAGQVTLKLPRVRKTFTRMGGMTVGPRGCSTRLLVRLPKSAKKKRATATLKFLGNSAIAPTSATTKVTIK